MNVYVGTDIVEVNRIKKSIEEHGNKFLCKVFTDDEIEYCEGKKDTKYQHYAARFAAKEATFKSVSNLLKDKYSITWKNIQVKNEESGRPKIDFMLINKDVEKELNIIKSIDVSLSHEKEYAIANVTVII